MNIFNYFDRVLCDNHVSPLFAAKLHVKRMRELHSFMNEPDAEKLSNIPADVVLQELFPDARE